MAEVGGGMGESGLDTNTEKLNGNLQQTDSSVAVKKEEVSLLLFLILKSVNVVNLRVLVHDLASDSAVSSRTGLTLCETSLLYGRLTDGGRLLKSFKMEPKRVQTRILSRILVPAPPLNV